MVTTYFFQDGEYLCASNMYNVLPFSECEDSIRITWNLFFRGTEQFKFPAASELHILGISEN